MIQFVGGVEQRQPFDQPAAGETLAAAVVIQSPDGAAVGADDPAVGGAIECQHMPRQHLLAIVAAATNQFPRARDERNIGGAPLGAQRLLHFDVSPRQQQLAHIRSFLWRAARGDQRLLGKEHRKRIAEMEHCPCQAIGKQQHVAQHPHRRDSRTRRRSAT